MLEIAGLRKVYDGHGRQVEALRDITLTVAEGEIVCVVGPSGCGKTTLLRWYHGQRADRTPGGSRKRSPATVKGS